MHDKILILDFGSQVTQLIARRVREAQVYCEIHPSSVSDDFVRSFGAKAVILSGSHASTYEDHQLRAPQAVWDAGVPVLGICYGMQTMAVQLGGEVAWSDHREFGYAEVRAHGHTRLLDGVQDFATADGHGMLKVWMSHGDKVSVAATRLQADGQHAQLPDRRHGRRDARLLRGAVPPRGHPHAAGRGHADSASCATSPAAAATGSWATMSTRRWPASATQVGDEEVILGLSGGVDSSVAAALIHRAIGDQLTCVFVDHGLLRLNEGQMVMDMFAGRLHAKVVHVQAAAQFLGHLQGVTDPEQKRKIIGREFVEVFQAEAAKLKGAGKQGGQAGWPRAPSTPTWWKAAARPARRPPSRATTTWVACLPRWA